MILKYNKRYKPKQKIYRNKSCKTFSHIDENGNKVFKNKKAFDTQDDAIKEQIRINNKPNQIHKVVTYNCKTCGKYHIGRTSKVINNN